MNTGTQQQMSVNKRLHNKSAIITGAGSGIGAATAILFASEGASVMVTGDKEESIKETALQIRNMGGVAEYAKLDISSELEWAQVVTQTITLFGKVNILVNNAGISGNLFLPLEERTRDEFNRVLTINLTGHFLGIKSVAAFMNTGDSIVNISSIAGITGNAGGNAYTASKGGSRMLSKGAAIDLAPKGIRVNSVHPGYVDTPMVRNMEGSQDFKEKAIGATPLGRGASSMEIAQGILFLASDEASFITGAELVMDGGFTAF